MKAEQARLVQEIVQENVITLNGLEANVYPCDEGILIDNNPLNDEEIEWDTKIVNYPTFLKIIAEEDGSFSTR